MSHSAPPAMTTRRAYFILAICCMSLLLIGMDVTIVNVAVPAIQRNLHAPMTDLQWVMDAYTLVLGSLLMLSGSMADRFGRKRVFQLGLSIFILGSVACSFAPNTPMLIMARAFQGLGASMMNPVALSIISTVFTEPKARAQALGIWGSVMGISLAVGQVVGGALTQSMGWRSIFLINVPIGVLAFTLTALYVPDSRAARARAFDPIGQLLIFIALGSFTAAVIEGPRIGWSSGLSIGLFALAVAAVIAFIRFEPTRREPLVDLRFFQSVPFSGATLTAVLSFACFSSFLFLNAIYLQDTRGFDAFNAGLSTLPLALTSLISAPLSGRMVGHYGNRPSLLLAGLSFVLATLMLTQLSDHTPLWQLLTAYAVFGVGLGSVNPAISNTAVSGMPKSQTGVAAAVASTSRQIGASMGVAIGGTVVSVSRQHGTDFSSATHTVWWGMVLCSLLICMLAIVTSSTWARASTRKVEALLSG